MKNVKKSEYKIYGAVAGFFVMAIAGFLFIINPIIREIIVNSDVIQEKKIDNEINREGISRISEMEKLQDLVRQKKYTFDVLIGSGGEVGFFKKVESLAVETGNRIELEIKDKEVIPTSKKTKTKQVGIMGSLPYQNYILMEITLLGNYENLIKFLNKLEKNEKYVNVASLNISKMDIVENSVNVFDSRLNVEDKIKKKEILQSIINLVVYVKE